MLLATQINSLKINVNVLSYSPLIPGPKKGDIDTRALNEGPLDLPIRTIK